jgi:hypothetical protein
LPTIGYADNPSKTDGFGYVKSYRCDYFTAANEFALAKQLYENHTGRGGRSDDIIAYHLRQSFKPGEITLQVALEVGYALAYKFTHGSHPFVCAVHTDKRHIHCHIIFSAVNTDYDRKFRNPIPMALSALTPCSIRCRRNWSARAYHDEIRVFHENKEAARHRRAFGNGTCQVNIYHYLNTLEKKPRGDF